MKHAVRILALMGVVAAMATSIAAQDANTITVAFAESQPQTLDPHAATSVDEFMVLRNVCEGLTDYDPATLQPVPGLAESWTISDDGLVYTFKLREGVTFSDGSALDANDVKYSFDRLSDPAFGTSYTAGLVLQDIVGWDKARPVAPKVDEGTPTPAPVEPAHAISGVSVVDAQTVQITLARPVTSFLVRLTLPGGVILAQDSANENTASTGPVCAGAYSVKEFVQNDHLTLEANPNYWSGAPEIPTAVIRVIPEASSQVIEFEAGNLDISVAPEADLPRLMADTKLSAELLTVPSLSLFNFRVNLLDPKMGDVRVRQALSYAMDRQLVVDTVLQGQGVPAEGLYPEGLSASDPTYKPYERDVEKAKKLLADAGYPNGIELTVRTAQVETENRVLAAIASTVAEAGITLNVNSTEASVYTQDRNACNMEMGSIAWGMDYPDPENMVVLVLANSASRRACGYDKVDVSPQIADLYTKAVSLPLGEERDATFREIQKLAIDNLLIIPIYNGATTRLVNPRVGGLPVDSAGTIRFAFMTLSSK